MKKTLLFALAFWPIFLAHAQEIYHDSTALAILDKMSQTIGEIKSLKFKTRTAQDVAFAQDYLIKDFSTAEYIFQGSDHLLAKISHNGNEKFYLYDGAQMVYYSLNENLYAVADAPPTTLEMLNLISNDFGIELVIADFLYPDFTAELIENMDYLEFLGRTEIEGEKYFHIGGANESMTFQIWVTEDFVMRPNRVVITYLGEPYARQLEVTFDDWQINQSYPESIFGFMPPPNSKQIGWIKKN